MHVCHLGKFIAIGNSCLLDST